MGTVSQSTRAEGKLERKEFGWQSPAVGEHMGIARFGHYGKPVILFPTGGGDYLDAERFLLVKSVAPLIEAGRIKLYLVDSVCRWAFASKDAQPRQKSLMQAKYSTYLETELFPFIKSDSGNTTDKFVVAGASMGGYNALNSAAKFPQWIDRMIGMSGTYINDRRMHGYWDENYYYNAPHQFLPRLGEGEQLNSLRNSLFILAQGQNWENQTYAPTMAKILDAKGIPNRHVVWGGDSGHDWPTWRTMLPLFLNRLVP